MSTEQNAKPLSTWWRKIRICWDKYAGYEVQVWTVYWPFWRMYGGINTFLSVEAAEEYARSRGVIKYL